VDRYTFKLASIKNNIKYRTFTPDIMLSRVWLSTI
jgi:hypothetical protein